MSIIILIAIILVCVALSFFVLIQNPKGGGMAGAFGGIGNSVMGAKQSSEGVEKATWVSMGLLAGIVLLSFVMLEKPSNSRNAGNEAGAPLKATTAPIQAPPVNNAPPAKPAQSAPAANGAGQAESATNPLPQPTEGATD